MNTQSEAQSWNRPAERRRLRVLPIGPQGPIAARVFQTKSPIAEGCPLWNGIEFDSVHGCHKKSKESNVDSTIIFDPAYAVSDPELTHASRLGKQALKDQKIMAMLWHKFKSQSKIASLLGVNRSSVNRRCKDYSLE